jgi:HD superfamily phosphohydrolase
VRDFRDPVYGFISLDDLETQILDSQPAQRLRWITQLGPTSLVYPSATHTRFEHSLGTLQASTLLFDRLVEQSENLGALGWKRGSAISKGRRMLRLASLLHDLGHAPFSHASEELLPGGIHHEEVSRRLILETDIGRMVDAQLGRGAAVRVAAIATGEATTANDIFLSQLLTGDLGSDRLDYLARDSLHLGVAYGRFDLHRFVYGIHVRTNDRTGTPELAIEDGAVHAVEGVLLARYFMFLQVYFHKTRRILDWHLQNVLSEILPGGRYPADLKDYLLWDDPRVLSELRKADSEHGATALLERGHFRVAYESLDHPEPHEIERFDWLSEDAMATFGSDVYVDRARKDPYNYTTPPLQVLYEGSYLPLEERSVLLNNLRPIDKMRIYASGGRRDEVAEFCRTFWQGRREATGI